MILATTIKYCNLHIASAHVLFGILSINWNNLKILYKFYDTPPPKCFDDKWKQNKKIKTEMTNKKKKFGRHHFVHVFLFCIWVRRHKPCHHRCRFACVPQELVVTGVWSDLTESNRNVIYFDAHVGCVCVI